MFRLTGLKKVGKVGTHFFCHSLFMHFERYFAFQNAQNYIYSRKYEKKLG